MTIHSADENWTMGTYNPTTHKVVPIDACLCEKTFTPPLSAPKNFGAVVEASSYGTTPKRQKWMRDGKGIWQAEDGTWTLNWSDLINPVVISEGLK